MAVSEGPFAGVATPAGVCVQASQTTIMAEIDKIIALIPSGAEGSSPMAHPDFDKMSPEAGVKLRAELTQLKTSIDAMAIS